MNDSISLSDLAWSHVMLVYGHTKVVHLLMIQSEYLHINPLGSFEIWFPERKKSNLLIDIFFSVNFCNFILSTLNTQTRARELKGETEIT